MTEIYQSKPTAASARARKTAAEFEEIARDAPEAMRALAETNIAQTQELYERSKQTLEGVLDSWERTFDAAGQGAVALNRKVIELTQRNINSGFDREELGCGKEPRRGTGTAKYLLAPAARRVAQPSRRGAHPVCPGGKGHGRADEGADVAPNRDPRQLESRAGRAPPRFDRLGSRA
jgi:hypothetical protein